jgi:exonuclease SbcD
MFITHVSIVGYSGLWYQIPMRKKEPGTFRILHTADWHLGKTLADQSREQEHQAFLQWLLVQVRDQKVDWILLSGDVFDSSNPPTYAQNLYFSFIAGLIQLGTCGLSLISGNHDSQSYLDAPKELLAQLGVRVAGSLAPDLSDRIQVIPSPENPRAIVGLIPFLRDRDVRQGKAGESGEDIRRALISGISGCYQETLDAMKTRWNQIGTDNHVPVLIGMGHLTVAGSAKSESEREIHIGGLGALSPEHVPSGYDYIALGHLHRPQWAHKEKRIRYSGSPIGLSFSEVGDTKSVTILDLGYDKEQLEDHGQQIQQPVQVDLFSDSHAELDQPGSGAQPRIPRIQTWELPVPVFRTLIRVRLGSENEADPKSPEELVSYLDQIQAEVDRADGAYETDRANVHRTAGNPEAADSEMADHSELANPCLPSSPSSMGPSKSLGVWAEVRVEKASQFSLQQLMSDLAQASANKPWSILKVVREGSWDSGDLADHWQPEESDLGQTLLDHPLEVFRVLLGSRRDQLSQDSDLDRNSDLENQLEREFLLLYESLNHHEEPMQ